MQIAIFHLFFNCTTALITTPLIKFLVAFSKCVIKDKKNEETIKETLIDNVNDISVIARSEDSFYSFKENNNEDNKNNIKPSDNDNGDKNEIKGKDL